MSNLEAIITGGVGSLLALIGMQLIGKFLANVINSSLKYRFTDGNKCFMDYKYIKVSFIYQIN